MNGRLTSEHMCRSCLSIKGMFQSIFNIDEEFDVKISFAEMIMSSSSSINIILNDGLPGEICSDCAEKVLEMFKFKIFIEQNDQILRSHLYNYEISVPESSETYILNKSSNSNLYQDLINEVECEEYVIEEDLLEIQEIKNMDGSSCDINVNESKSVLNENVDSKKKHKISLSEKKKNYNNKPFICKFCKKSFAKKGYLQQHEVIHSGEKRYRCNECNKRFKQLSHLQRHYKTHSGEKPYKCKYCQKTFAQLSEVQSHLRLHSGEKPYLCDICQKSFRQLSNLRCHLKNHLEKDITIINKDVSDSSSTFTKDEDT